MVKIIKTLEREIVQVVQLPGVVTINDLVSKLVGYLGFMETTHEKRQSPKLRVDGSWFPSATAKLSVDMFHPLESSTVTTKHIPP